ncbi:MAG: succinate dehydrogenase assembly factor 2 [Alphaproteobacteria bacterium]|nr:succinate dehydrogenase assembly factor 2 [Alphaproteobacteria bacterium]
MTDTQDIRLKKLLFRSQHRGTRESDLLLGGFAAANLATMTPEQLDRYEALLEENDADLIDWITGRSAPPVSRDHDILNLLVNFRLKT